MAECVVEIGGRLAGLVGWEWSSDDGPLVALLNSELDLDGPSPSDPFPQLTEAKAAAARHGGKIIRVVRPPAGKPGVVY